jgi:ribonuclease P protein component
LSNNTSPTEQFGRQCRLLTARDYAQVFAARKVLRGLLFALHYHPTGGMGPRLGLVIPKKQAKTAVMRNAIKRQARELFRHRTDLPAMDAVLRLAQPIRLDRPISRSDRLVWRNEIDRLLGLLAAAGRKQAS